MFPHVWKPAYCKVLVTFWPEQLNMTVKNDVFLWSGRVITSCRSSRRETHWSSNIVINKRTYFTRLLSGSSDSWLQTVRQECQKCSYKLGYQYCWQFRASKIILRMSLNERSGRVENDRRLHCREGVKSQIQKASAREVSTDDIVWCFAMRKSQDSDA